MAEKKEVAVITPHVEEDAVIVAAGVIPRKKDVISAWLKNDQGDPEVRAEQIHASIIQSIMDGATPAEILAMNEAEKLPDMAGQRFEFLSFQWNDSDFEEGPPVYFSLKCRNLDTGTRHTLNTGDQAVMAQVMRMEQIGGFPFKAVVQQGTRMNKYNRYPIRLVLVED